MNCNFPTTRWTAALVAAGLIWAVAPERGTAAAGSWTAAATATASFLQQPGGPAWASQRGAAGGVALPNSVLPNNQPRCSVETDGAGTERRCSTRHDNLRCSAHDDAGQQCSVFQAGAGNGRCSTNGSNRSCSVLDPPGNANQPSQCSTFGTAGLSCSVMFAGVNQFCSAQNPASVPGNTCSVHTSGECSVLGGGRGGQNSCSVRGPVGPADFPKQCSVFSDGGKCSIVRLVNRGECTALGGAPSGTCSVFSGIGHCSVIRGQSGQFCRIP